MDSITIITILSVVLLSAYLYLKRGYTYWKRRGLDYIEPTFYYGNGKKFAKGELSFGELFQELYRELKSRGLKHGGVYLFFRPTYIPLDLDIIKCILQKDFDHFRNHGMYVNEESDPLSGHLFNLEDAKWKNLRVKLTPTFTSGKMKMMFPTLAACSLGLEDVLKDYAIIQDAVDIKDVLSRFTTDVIASCAFGLESNSLKNPNVEFRTYGKRVFQPTFLSRMKRLVTMLVPRHILIKIGFKVTSNDIESFFVNLVRDTIDYREKNGIHRKDFLQLLLQLKNSGEVTDDGKIQATSNENGQNYMTINEMAAQSFVFFAAGFETSATTMSFALYELAVNQDIQEKLRKEIISVLKKHDDKLTYEAVMEMTYLDKIIQETLRKYPPAIGVPRVCNTTYNVPGTDIVIEPDTRVHIPIIGIHHDAEYYPDPDVFDPERFNEENKAKRPAFAYLPFGEGPRICIGARFGILQSKMGLICIMRRFKISLNEKTQTPIRFDHKSFILSVKGGVWLNIFKAGESED